MRLLLAVCLTALRPFAGFSHGRQPLPKALPGGLRCSSSDSESSPPFGRWTNPAYEPSEVDRWWRELGSAMLTLGDKGLLSGHRNTLLEQLNGRERVRVKFSSDRLDQMAIADSLMRDEGFSAAAEVLEVRRRGLMVGRRPGRGGVSRRLESHGMCLDFFSQGRSCERGSGCRFSHDARLLSPERRALLMRHLASLGRSPDKGLLGGH